MGVGRRDRAAASPDPPALRARRQQPGPITRADRAIASMRNVCRQAVAEAPARELSVVRGEADNGRRQWKPLMEQARPGQPERTLGTYGGCMGSYPGAARSRTSA